MRKVVWGDVREGVSEGASEGALGSIIECEEGRPARWLPWHPWRRGVKSR